MTVYDREHRAYEVTPEEAEDLIATGAYFKNPQGEAPMKRSDSPLVTIYDVKTGKPLQRRRVDARELVASGAYTDKAPGSHAPATLPHGAPVKTPDQDKTPEPPKAPEELTREQLMAELSKVGIQYRANMSRAELLALWQQGKKD